MGAEWIILLGMIFGPPLAYWIDSKELEFMAWAEARETKRRGGRIIRRG